jgi:hypothetical protein
MARALTAAELVGAFRRWGLDPIEQPGWATHDRGPMDDVHGIIVHHTGDDVPDDRSWKILWDGRSDLPGPLCQWGMRDDGRPHMMGARRANHAGKGSSVTLAHVRNEDYSGNLRPGPDDVDGNGRYYGQETMYSGRQKMTPLAYGGTILACAAVCDAYTRLGSPWTGKSVIGHKEHSLRKPDPASQDMASLRADVDRALAMGPDAAAQRFLRPDLTLPPKLDPDAAVAGLIGEHYRNQLGGSTGRLGRPASQELPILGGQARRVDFEFGAIWWSGPTGAHEVHGDILKVAYAGLRWEEGPLGLPLTDELVCPDGRGRYNAFQGGLAYWTPETGAHAVYGDIAKAYAAAGWERDLGYPVDDEHDVEGGRAQTFERGSLTWDRATGTVVAA